jgi:[acyl-carrier-protein] S-malonyltransferase
MAAILGLDPDLIRVICEQVEDKLTPLPGDPAALNFVPGSAVVAAANLNSPGQTVISGAKAAVERAAELCKQAGAKRAVMLPVSAPFHCVLMQPAQESLAKDLAGVEFRDPAFPVAANVSAKLIATGDAARDALIAQVTGAVRWVECIELLAAQGATQFVEVGPGRVLSGLLKQIQGKDAAAAMNVEDSVSLEKTLAGLAAK